MPEAMSILIQQQQSQFPAALLAIKSCSAHASCPTYQCLAITRASPSGQQYASQQCTAAGHLHDAVMPSPSRMFTASCFLNGLYRDLIAQILNAIERPQPVCTPQQWLMSGSSIIWECYVCRRHAVSAQITGVQWCRDGNYLTTQNKHCIALDCDAIIKPRLGPMSRTWSDRRPACQVCSLELSRGRYDDCAHF